MGHTKISETIDEKENLKFSIEQLKKDLEKVNNNINNLQSQKEIIEKEMKQYKEKHRLLVNFPHDYKRLYNIIFD